MLLTIDVGNTNMVLGVFEGEEVVEHWRIATDPARTADEIAVVLQGLIGQSAVLKDPDISGIALCSASPCPNRAGSTWPYALFARLYDRPNEGLLPRNSPRCSVGQLKYPATTAPKLLPDEFPRAIMRSGR